MVFKKFYKKHDDKINFVLRIIIKIITILIIIFVVRYYGIKSLLGFFMGVIVGSVIVTLWLLKKGNSKLDGISLYMTERMANMVHKEDDKHGHKKRNKR